MVQQGMRVCLIVSALGLSGCASLSESECRQQRWYEVGARDGSQGRSTQYYTQHIEACSQYGIRLQLDDYQAGYRQGLKTYCTASSGYREGARVDEYQQVCPAELEAEFLNGYVDGLRSAADRVESDLDSARSKRRRLDDDLHYAKDPAKRKEIQQELDSAESSLNSLYDQQQTIQRLLNQYRGRRD